MSLIHFLLDPMVHGSVLLFAWIHSIFKRKSSWVRLTGFLFGLWVFLVIVSPLPIYLVEHKENIYLPVNIDGLDTNNTWHIVILGAGKISDSSLPYTTQLSGTVQKRLIEGIRIYRHLPYANIIGSASSGKSKFSQARAVTEAALEIGVLTEDTLQLPSPYNTESEAKAFVDRFSANYNLILVTSALHMPRAIFWFQRYGLDPVPAPCDYRVLEDPNDPLCRWWPSIQKVSLLKAWIHEAIGLMYAKCCAS